VAVLRAAVRRAFEHAEMKQAARSFASGCLPDSIAPALGGAGPSADLRAVAGALVDLQEARHEADYDFGRGFTRRETQGLLITVEDAFRAWRRVRRSPEGRVFLVALLLQKRLAGR
jgi:hypothetical protein